MDLNTLAKCVDSTNNENLKIKYFPNDLTEYVFFKFPTAKT